MDVPDLIRALRELASVPSVAEMEKARAEYFELCQRYDTEPEFRARVDEAIAECERDWPALERLTKPDGYDLLCLCGNEPALEGFYASNWIGDQLEPVIGGAWKGRLYCCGRCGRIIDQDTLRVVGVKDL